MQYMENSKHFTFGRWELYIWRSTDLWEVANNYAGTHFGPFTLYRRGA